MHQFVTYPSPLPASLPPFSEAGFLVNQPAQLMAQSKEDCWLVCAVNEQGMADIRCALFSDNNLAISPLRHSFGSVEFINNLPDDLLTDFLDALEQAVRRAGLMGLRLVHYPRAYAPRQTDQLLRQLIDRGYRVVDEQCNFHLEISGKSFREGLHSSARRRLAKSQRADLVARHWPTPDIDRVVSFLEASRRAQGYALTMPTDALRHWLSTAPEDYLVFGVFDQDDTPAALTVAVRMRTDILYNFLPADNADYRPLSPAILLTECLYHYCQQHQFRLLDLGICVDENRNPKPDLMRFKRNLGAEESEKVTLEKVEQRTNEIT
ncbi:GNAT family N-acetyltransferase [Fibrella sp. HMF5335]|uniref:GNAT family N-acetyltransferase n=1 Tax=Fibrella rubiginis TaxID=2817060 RepID=A0A939K720_9BACT|nr:GNAT family N-acetyltransferase [Fibrella rubiginis]MBO0939473.1 GNAT family N-acetyltransferase [Fibrella rubiginis]